MWLGRIPGEGGGDMEALLSSNSLLCFSSSQIAASPGYPPDAMKEEKERGRERKGGGGRGWGEGEERERGCSGVNILKA